MVGLEMCNPESPENVEGKSPFPSRLALALLPSAPPPTARSRLLEKRPPQRPLPVWLAGESVRVRVLDAPEVLPVKGEGDNNDRDEVKSGGWGLFGVASALEEAAVDGADMALDATSVRKIVVVVVVGFFSVIWNKLWLRKFLADLVF